MIELAKQVYRGIKYSIFTTRQKESEKYHKGRRDMLIGNYLSKHPVKKLQIGAQSNSITGWLNVDLLPKTPAVAYMDATEVFPFPAGTFDYIYSEHMIEHITFDQGLFMLKECFRVMKSGARIRISTPDAGFLFALYAEEKSSIQKSYIEFSRQRYFKCNEPAMDITVINNFFRDWGHQFIHDEKTLRYLMNESGFTGIQRKLVGESGEPELQNVEQHGKEITEDYNRLESIVMEAVKP